MGDITAKLTRFRLNKVKQLLKKKLSTKPLFIHEVIHTSFETHYFSSQLKFKF